MAAVGASRAASGVGLGLVRSEEPAADLALTAWSCVQGLSGLLVEGVLDKPVAEIAEMVTRDLFPGLGSRQG